MADFYAACNDCEAKLLKKLKRKKRTEPTQEEYEEGVLFETTLPFEPTPEQTTEAMTCPRCQGCNTVRTYYGYNTTGYIRGNGYLDRAGCHRDMNLHRLTTDDPYAQYRVTGEVDDMKIKLKRAGQHNPKTKHYAQGGGMKEAVREAISTPIPPPPAVE